MAGAVNCPVDQVYVDEPTGNNVGAEAAHWYISSTAVREPFVPLVPEYPDETMLEEVQLIEVVVAIAVSEILTFAAHKV